MDRHRRRSALVWMTPDGRRLGTGRISNSPARLRTELAKAAAAPQVVLEACYGWYWAVDVLEAADARCTWCIRRAARGSASAGSRTTVTLLTWPTCAVRLLPSLSAGRTV